MNNPFHPNTTLLQETLSCMSHRGKTPDDIVFIGSLNTGHSCTWDEFTILADRHYDKGFGAQKVATDLAICFSDGSRFTRWEHDGSEGWQNIPPNQIPIVTCPIASLFVSDEQVGWLTLDEIHNPNED
jgi:hypothetical protein